MLLEFEMSFWMSFGSFDGMRWVGGSISKMSFFLVGRGLKDEVHKRIPQISFGYTCYFI